MSSSDSEQNVAFQVTFGSSPVEALATPPELPRHLQVRLQTYVNARPRKNISDRMEAAERRRQNHFARRAENARMAEERCRRIAEAMEVVTDYNRHLKGDAVGGRAPNPNQVKTIYASVKEDLKMVLGRVNREALRLHDRKYVHNPVSYRPQRRNTHTDRCTCECCYLEDADKMASIQKDLNEILTGMHAAGLCSDSGETRLGGDADLEGEGHAQLKRTDGNVDSDAEGQAQETRSGGDSLGFSAHAVLEIPARSYKQRVTWADKATSRSQACHAALSVGPDCAVQTAPVCCPECRAEQSLARLTRAAQTGVESRDAATQTEPEQFSCLGCERLL